MRRIALLAACLALMLGLRPALAQATEIDVVLLVDTSASMIDDLDRLCADLPGVLKSIRAGGLNARVTVLGVTDRYECAQTSVRSRIANSAAADDEDWGIAAAELSEGYDWLPSARRLIIPLSDAGPASGDPVDDPGPDRDVTARAIRAAVANKVALSPVLASPDAETSADDSARLEALAQDMAAKTGGRAFVSNGPDDLPGAIEQLIVSVAETQTALTAIAAAIPTPPKVSLDPAVLITNAALAALAAIVVGLTAALVRESFAADQRPQLPSNRVTGALASLGQRVRAALNRATTPTAWQLGNASVVRLVSIAILTAIFALAALIASFLDPNFQPSAPTGIVTFVTLLVALAAVTVSAAFAGSRVARGQHIASGLQIRPGALLLVVAGVAISRSLGFLPGYLVGLPAGLVILAGEHDHDADARVGRASVFAALGIGLAAWLLAWPLEALTASLSSGVESGAASFALSIAGGVESALLAIFLVAFQFTLFELLPIRATVGRLWYARRRPAWGVVFAVVTFAALHTLFNPNRSGLDALRNPHLLPLAAIVAAYSGITLVAWLLTNESRLREPGKLNRRSALAAGALIIAWLGGLACMALAEVVNTFSASTLLILAAIAVAAVAAVWMWGRVRARRAQRQE